MWRLKKENEHSDYPDKQSNVWDGLGCFKVTAFEQEHFQWRCQELTSECCNIQERGFDNIRSIRVESGAFVCCEYPGYPGQQYIMECDKHNGDYQHWKTSRC